MQQRNGSRRKFLQGMGALGVVVATAPYVKTSHSAGKLAIGTWDHWVPGANDVLREVCEEWAGSNGVDLTIDFITSIGNKLLLTAQAESRAETGHDVYCVPQWMPSMFRHRLEPVDDVVNDIISAHGALNPAAEFFAHLDGVWRGAPAPAGSLSYPSVSRLDLYREHAGIDLTSIFPAGGARNHELVDAWSYDSFLTAAQKLHAVGKPFGAPIAPTPDGNQWLGSLFAAYGAEVMDASGDITVDSDEIREVLEYLSRLTQYMPDSVYAWDDASNNRFMISGSGSTAFNPPSIWAVSSRDMPAVAEQLWHHDSPRGPKGRYRASAPFFWGIWDFSSNISAGKDLLRYLARKDVVDRLVAGSKGFDIPLITSHYQSNDLWKNAGPPSGVLYNYPIRGDEVPTTAGVPAPPEYGAQIFAQGILPNLVARVTQGGDTFDDAIGWAENEMEGIMRG